MRYLVTGGAGFIGSNTVDELVRRGHAVTVLDDLSAGRAENLAGVMGQIEFIRGSVTDLREVERACRGAECVLHLAARTSVPQSIAEPLETHRVNVDGTLNVLSAARDARVRRVVFASSCAVYGNAPPLPTREDAPAAPISPYAATKLIGELYGGTFCRVYGLQFVALRYFNVFGRRQDPGSPYSGVLSRFAAAWRDRSAPIVYGDGEQSRDFIHIEDVVRANLEAGERPGIAGEVLNVGSGQRYTVNYALKLLQEFAHNPAKPRYAEPRPGDIRHSQADLSRTRERLGFLPQISFEEGLRRTWDWYCAACPT